MNNIFFTFIKPYLTFIDNGSLYRKSFCWLYMLIAVINLLAPIVFLFQAISSGFFSGAPAKIIIASLLVWIVIAFAGWVSFQLWWERKSRVINTSSENDQFVATPVFSDLIQTIGEWLGTWIGIVGFLATLIASIFLGDEGSYLLSKLGIPFLSSGFLSVIMMPVYGFLIILFTRFLAEQFRALSAIANNTKKG